MKKLFSCLAIVAALLWVAEPVQADRVVAGYTLVPVTAAEVTAMSITRQTDGQGGVAIVVTWAYEVKDSTGEVRYTSSVSTELTPAQRTQLLNFSNAVGIPLANTQENL